MGNRNTFVSELWFFHIKIWGRPVQGSPSSPEKMSPTCTDTFKVDGISQRELIKDRQQTIVVQVVDGDVILYVKLVFVVVVDLDPVGRQWLDVRVVVMHPNGDVVDAKVSVTFQLQRLILRWKTFNVICDG